MDGGPPPKPAHRSVEPGDIVEVTIDGIAGGGTGVGRAPDGRALFVEGALPGERVEAEVVEVRRRHGRAVLRRVATASPHRVEPPCPHVARGCGGCDWQHVDPSARADLHRRIVADALTRIGRIVDPVVEHGAPIVTPGRTTVRAAVYAGRAGFRRRRSHEVVAVDSCLVAHPAVADILERGRFGPAEEVVVRVGARTGDRMVVVTPSAVAVEVPDDVVVVGRDGAASGPAIVEAVAGRSWQVSAGSFFQPSPEGAEGLVAEVDAAIDRLGTRHGTLVDLCSGVGLLAGTVSGGFDEVIAVESSPSAVADARHNLDGVARVEATTMAAWAPVAAACVVADPPRAGLDRVGVERILATGSGGVVLVSCDAGALGRDARLLVEAGFEPVRSRVLDLFPGTSRVEVVTAFRRRAAS